MKVIPGTTSPLSVKEPNVANQSEHEDKQVAPEATKPDWMTDDDFGAATSIMPPERVKQLYGKFDPNSSEPFYEKLYKSIKKDPEYDEKKERAARSMGSIGDALSLLAQIAGGGGEGLIERRGPDKLPSAGTNKMIEEWKERYRKDRDTYDAGLMSSRLNDIQQARADYQRDRSTMLSGIFNARKQKAETERDRTKQILDKYKFDGQIDLKKAEIELKKAGLTAKQAQQVIQNRLQERKINLQESKIKGVGKEPFLTVTDDSGQKVDLSRSDAIAIRNRAFGMRDELQNKKDAGGKLTDEENRLLSDISVLLQSLNPEDKTSDNSIRVFAERYYPLVGNSQNDKRNTDIDTPKKKIAW